MAWGNTKTIGCGFVTFINPADNAYRQKLVCNYGPGGNYRDTALYTTGPAGSQCPLGARGGLCRQDAEP